jgi:hypothetical protein
VTSNFVVAHHLDLASSWPKKPGTRLQAKHRQYTGFQNPAMAFFAHPFVVRLSYFPSLDYKPRFASETAFPEGDEAAGTGSQNMAIPPLT